MLRTPIVMYVICALAAGAMAQTAPPADIARVPEAIAKLPWKSVDLAGVSPEEYARALLIMNHVLDEASAWRTSEADLMSQYIDDQKLGSALASAPPPPAVGQLGYDDGLKVAVAMLRGPLATSSYATEFAGMSSSSLQAYRQMYERTCQRRWSELEEARQQVLCMSAFLNGAGKMQDYQSWAKAECQRRQEQYEQQLSGNKAAAAAAAKQRVEDAQMAKEQQLELENQQLKHALAAAQQQQQQQQETAPAAAQQPAAVAYPGYGYGGLYAPAYYGAYGAWARDAAYAGAARANTEQRVAGWHGASAAGAHYGGARR